MDAMVALAQLICLKIVREKNLCQMKKDGEMGMTYRWTIEDTIKGLEGMILSTKFIEHDFNGVVNIEACEQAIDLLKAQEARVMDADEIVLSAEPSGWLWLEMKNGHCGEAFKAGRTISGWINFGNGFESSFTSFLPKEYGKTWRCWTSRPTEEQRKEAEWE